MNLTIARALLEDSRQQVLDNKVFRLLVLLTAIPILASFLIGFYPDHLQLLWGFEPIYWRDMPNFLGGTNSPGPEHAAAVIQGWQGTIVDFFAGNLGVLFCIAATAFFMPRVLEKGAADTMFSKPVGRLAILLSRYFAGLLFVGAIAFVLVFGMFLGFGLRSGYWDPGFLWGALTLVYLFGMMHAFSLCVAVLTRSSTAAILLTFVLYALSSAFHGGWMIWSYVDDKQASEELRAALQGPDAGEDDDAADGGERKGGDPGVVLDFLRTSLSVAHYILPKTSDADLITAKLRRALSERASDLASADDEIEVKRAPLGFHLVESTRDDLDGAGVRWEADSGAQAGSYVLRRFARPEVERGSGARARTLPQTGIWRAKDLADELQARTDLLRAPEYDSESLGGVRAGKVTWQEPSANGPRERERLCFHVNDHMYELDVDLSTNGEEAYVAGSRRQRFLADKNLVIGNVELLEPGEWYAQKFDWTAPWRFNVFFSIGSSLAFILAMLGIAWWRLARIDFLIPHELLEALHAVVGDAGLVRDASRRTPYECDGLAYERCVPDVVLLPASTEEVSRCLALCHAHGVPVVPRGAGTGLTGGATPVPGGVLLGTGRMRRVLEVNAADRFARVQAGLVNVDLTRACAHEGLFYAPDPSSQAACSLGGNVANNSGGPHCFKYGNTTRHILGLVVVLPDGEVLDLSGPEVDPEGYDLVGLFTGSEGMFGVATEITVALTPSPEVTETLLGIFPSLDATCDAVSAIIAAGLEPSALEILDKLTIAAVEASVFAAGYPADAEAVLLIEVEGAPVECRETSDAILAILERNGVREVRRATDELQRKKLWAGRKGAYGAMGRVAPDLYVSDVVVPRTKLRELVRATTDLCVAKGLRICNVFHAGDGNLHPNISYDRRDADEVRRVIEAGDEMAALCVAAGGTLSGEHGIGIEKRAQMELYFSPVDLALMHAVRDAWDPAERMNPGKLLPIRACMETRTRPVPAPAEERA